MILTGTTDVKRITVPDPESSVAIPTGVSFAVLKNVGANPMRFNFDGVFTTHYWTLEIGEQTPILQVKSGSTFYMDGDGGETTLEILCWG